MDFDRENLPLMPTKPQFKIDLLSKVKCSKAIDRKKHFIENKFFKLPCGLFYEGSLHFGKLQGKGLLLLQSIDVATAESKEVGRNLLYEGFFYNNQVEGRGELNFKGGGKFIGTFKCGVAHGNGVLYDSKGSQVVKGIWINGEYCQ